MRGALPRGFASHRNDQHFEMNVRFFAAAGIKLGFSAYDQALE